jgi:hypothetical protein
MKQEIVSAATLARGLAGTQTSITDFCSRFSLSNGAAAAIKGELKNPQTAQERFRFDLGEYQMMIAFKSVELDNGGTLTAPSERFDDIFVTEEVGHGREVRYSTKGQVVNENQKSGVD